MRTVIAVLFSVFLLSSTAMADSHSEGHPVLTPLEPKAMGRAYTDMLMGISEFQKNSGMDNKTFQLISLAAAAGMKCEYCILAHTAQAKKAGATDEEIKAVAMIAGIIAINSTILYANQYDLEKLREMMGQ
jgi:AhpD family alkylhydroperoxidase